MNNVYYAKLLKDKARVSQQIIHTEQQLRSLRETLAHLDEEEKSYNQNQMKYAELNRLFFQLKPLLTDCDLKKMYIRDPAKHKYTEIGFSDKLSDQEKRLYREFVTIFHDTDTPAFIGHNLFTDAQKTIIRNYGLTINQYVEQ